MLSTIIVGQMILNIVKCFPGDHNPCHCQITLLAYLECIIQYTQVDSMLLCICICSVTDHRGTRMWEEQRSDKQALR